MTTIYPVLPPVPDVLTLNQLKQAIEADLRKTQVLLKDWDADFMTPLASRIQLREEIRDMRAALRLIWQYAEAAEEAAIFDADEPIPFTVTEAAHALLTA